MGEVSNAGKVALSRQLGAGDQKYPPLRCRVRGGLVRCCARGSECHRDTSMQQHLPFFGLHTLAKLPHCKLSPPHLRWLLAAPACGAIDSNISAADSVTISIRMIWLPSPLTSQVQTPSRNRRRKSMRNAAKSIKFSRVS